MAKIKGNKKKNTLNGTGKNDIIYGYGGADKIYGGNGNDIIYGGTGYDKLYGGNGNDKIYVDQDGGIAEGGNGHDKIYNGNGDDTLKGGNGDDWIQINCIGNDKVSGGKGSDIFSVTDQYDYNYGCGLLITDFEKGKDKIDVGGAVKKLRATDADLAAQYDYTETAELLIQAYVGYATDFKNGTQIYFSESNTTVTILMGTGNHLTESDFKF